MELLLLLTVLIGVITIVVMILAGRYENKLKTSRFTLKKVFRNLSVRGYEGTALFDKTEKYLYEAGGGLSTEAFIFFHLIVFTVATIASFNQLVQLNIAKWLTQTFMYVSLGVSPLHVLVLINIQKRKRKILTEISKVTNVLYYSAKQGIQDDLVYFKCADMVEEPLKEYFKRLAVAHNTRQSVKELLTELRKLCEVEFLQNLVSTLMKKELTGQSEKSLKVFKSLMKTGKRTKYKVWRDARRLQVIGYAMLLGTCITVLLALPVILDVINDLRITWKS